MHSKRRAKTAPSGKKVKNSSDWEKLANRRANTPIDWQELRDDKP
jgi:hypothetical protein